MGTFLALAFVVIVVGTCVYIYKSVDTDEVDEYVDRVESFYAKYSPLMFKLLDSWLRIKGYKTPILEVIDAITRHPEINDAFADVVTWTTKNRPGVEPFDYVQQLIRRDFDPAITENISVDRESEKAVDSLGKIIGVTDYLKTLAGNAVQIPQGDSDG